MTPDDRRRQQLLREAAQKDIADIDALANSSAFNRYFVGQLNRIHKENVDLALSGKTLEDREKGRHRALLIRELTDMPAQHRQSAEKLLSSPLPGESRPTQVG